MFLNGVEIKSKIENGLFIDLDDEYTDMDFYREKTSEYNYIRRKYDKNYTKFGKYVGLYTDIDRDKLGYFYIAPKISIKPIYKFGAYIRYSELLEFGFLNDNVEQVKFLVEYMIEFAAKSGSYFIRIRTKEKAFEKFYEVLRLYPHTEDEKYIYLDFEPVNYDFAKHLVNYEGDKLSIKELYHLNAIGFKVYEDVCKYRLYDGDYFVVDRKTREVFYPDRVINVSENYKTLNRYSLTFMGAIISFHDYRFANTTIDLGYELEGYDCRLIKIGNELFTMQPFMLDEDGRPDKAFLIEFSENAYKKHGFTSLYLWDFAKFKFEIFYARTGERRFFLPNYVEE